MSTCGDEWNRTTDTRIFSPLLYQLSYITDGGKSIIFLKQNLAMSIIGDRPATNALKER
jgi:hypothetical protein